MKILTSSQNIIEGLNKININSSEDLLFYLPYRYEDMSYSDEENLVDKQKIKLLGKIISNPKHFSNAKIDIISFYIITKKNKIYNIKLYNRGYLLTTLELNEEYSISGTYNIEKKEVIVSSIVKGVIDDVKRLRSIYHLPQNINQATYRSLLSRTLMSMMDFLIDPMPNAFKQKYRLLDLKSALNYVHFPIDNAQISLGLRTLKYYECLEYCLKNHIIRGENKRILEKPKGMIDTTKINEFIKNLDFKLTHDQVIAIRDIILDMNQQSQMYRLLQGDVGTGKTIVASIALYGNYLRQKVGVFMAPTDSLARQQFESLKTLFMPYGIKVGLLIGGLKEKEKQNVKQLLKNGEIDILVGTHALFSKDVIYPSLGLAIIDEQHRFGVKQRNELLLKDDGCDLLLMSATPIPRTLALSIYGDLDISSLSQFPNENRRVITKIVSPQSSSIISEIKDCLLDKRQVFIVAPKITNNDDSLDSAEKIYDIYKTLFKEQVRILHGKMKSEEKAEILDDFIRGNFLILVSTTIVELGINVLNAGAIIIYSASSFGLATLHQLRGRVGRDGKEAICLLVDNDIDNPRLKILKDCSDGFVIAEEDLKMRGPGDVMGSIQSGFPSFSCLNIVDDFKMFECARDDANEIIKHRLNPEFKKYFDYVNKKMLNEEDITLFD